MRQGRTRSIRPYVALLAGAAVTLGLLAAVPAEAAEVSPVSSSGGWTVDGHGNGHGHGLSQYGARGAAIAGLTYQQILAFYYPGTALGISTAPISVALSATGADPTVQAETGLTVTGVKGTLPTAGTDLYRLVPRGTGFQLQAHHSTGWAAYVIQLAPARLVFSAPDGTIAVLRSSGARNYRGTVAGVRDGSAAITVNDLSLDNYVRGVVPSEMPASWQAAAVQAQAVAARSYARYYVDHPRDPLYDICDTTSCQVYGGLTAEQAGSNDAVAKTANQVLTYQGATIFAEFSASNGGMTSAGSQPYFVTKPDPYDNAGSGDPYLNYTVTVAASTVARAYGLRSVSQLQITGRAGGGQWGGLVTSGIVNGIDSAGRPAAITVTGVGLASAMGLSYSFFHIRPSPVVGHLDLVKLTALHSVTISGWAVDQTNGAASTAVSIVIDGGTRIWGAGSPRPDVQRSLKLASAAHGFTAVLPVPGGTHRVCVYALSLSHADHTTLGCVTVAVTQQPIGHVDQITAGARALYTVTGWGFDADHNGGPGRIAIYVDGSGVSLTGTRARSDVQRAYGLASDTVGFAGTVYVPPGRHSLCTYAINDPATPGSNVALGCRTVVR